MAKNFFKPLSEYLKSSQKEWRSRAEKENEPEFERQLEYEEGIHEMEGGRYENAVSHLKKATASRRYRKDAYYYLADCYQQLNMISLARKTYGRLMRLDYNYRDVQEKIRALDVPGAAKPLNRMSSPTRQPAARAGAATVAVSAEERYEILGTLHESKYSRVYRVNDTLLGRTIALKHIDQHYPDRNAYLQQMKERTALAHPNILRIYDIDEKQGQIAMEYVEGHDLRHTLHLKGALAPKMIMHIAVQLINGLHQAHTHGIIHHTLTPEHILLTKQCDLKITAFRAPDSFMRLQKTDDPYKYLYIPPELFQQKTLTTASNIYSFGIILYEMFTGKTPFRLQQIKAFVHQKTPLHYDESLLPPGVQPILQHCLMIRPDQRYPNIRSVGEELIGWYKQHQREEVHDEDIKTYKDYLLMAWADGKLTKEETEFLAHKRQELHITVPEAQTAETEVKQDLQTLLENA